MKNEKERMNKNWRRYLFILRKGVFMQKAERKGCSSIWEKLIYGFGDVGANLCWSFMAAFITMYYTDSAGIAAGAVGSLMLLARLLDGVTDVIGALLIQKVNTKWGKIRPWFWVAAPLLGIGLYMSFNIPASLDGSQKLMYAFGTYTFTGAVAFTIYNLAFTAILPLMSLDSDDRNKASAVQRVICGAGILLIMNVSPILIAVFGGEKSSATWHKISLLYAILCTVLVFLMGVIIKEKEIPTATDEIKKKEEISQSGAHEKVSLGVTLKKAIFNKYMPLLLIFFIAYYVGSTLYSGVMSYYCRDIMGNMSYVGILSLGKTIPMMIFIPFCPALFKKFGKRKVVICTLAGAALCSLLKMLNPASLTWMMAMNIIVSICNGPVSASMFTFVADFADYVRNKKGVRSEALTAMTSSVGTKLGSGVGSALIGWGLAIGGYQSAAAQQTAGALMSMKVMANIAPAIASLTILVCLLFWDMDKQK